MSSWPIFTNLQPGRCSPRGGGDGQVSAPGGVTDRQPSGGGHGALPRNRLECVLRFSIASDVGQLRSADVSHVPCLGPGDRPRWGSAQVMSLLAAERLESGGCAGQRV